MKQFKNYDFHHHYALKEIKLPATFDGFPGKWNVKFVKEKHYLIICKQISRYFVIFHATSKKRDTCDDLQVAFIN